MDPLVRDKIEWNHMSPEDGRKYIDSIIETLRNKELHAEGFSEFDKARFLSSLGLLLHDRANAVATQELTVAMAQASRDLQVAGAESANTARQLNNYTNVLARATVILAAATGLLVLKSAWQAYEAHTANMNSAAGSVVPALPPQAPSSPASPPASSKDKK
jgi:hypothetical protein